MKHTMTKIAGATAVAALVVPGVALAATPTAAVTPDDANATWTHVEASGHRAGAGCVQKKLTILLP